MTDPRRTRAVLLVDIPSLTEKLGLPEGVMIRGAHTDDGITLQVHLLHPSFGEVPELVEAPRLTLEEIQEAVARR